VSDSIVDLDRLGFTVLSKCYPNAKKSIDGYRAGKKYAYFRTYYSPCIASWFCHHEERANYILFFSQIEDNILRADLLFYDSRYISKECKFDNSAYYFGVGSEYLFLFGKDEKMKIALKQEMIYN
jgi:hypothetical protein